MKRPASSRAGPTFPRYRHLQQVSGDEPAPALPLRASALD